MDSGRELKIAFLLSEMNIDKTTTFKENIYYKKEEIEMLIIDDKHKNEYERFCRVELTIGRKFFIRFIKEKENLYDAVKDALYFGFKVDNM